MTTLFYDPDRIEDRERYKKRQNWAATPNRPLGSKWGRRALDTAYRYYSYLRGNILDIGCNDGLVVGKLRTHSLFLAFGVDLSSRMLAMASSHTDSRGYVCMAFQEHLPFPDKSFDIAICSHTLEHSLILPYALDEMQRVAKRGIIVVPLEPDVPSRDVHVWPFHSEWDLLLRLRGRGRILLAERLHRHQPEFAVVIDFGE